MAKQAGKWDCQGLSLFPSPARLGEWEELADETSELIGGSVRKPSRAKVSTERKP